MIVENEEDSYFVDLIDDMKWNMKFTWFELLIKWEEYEQRTWESYIMIKKNASILIKEFHEDHFLQSALTEWIKEENWWLLFWYTIHKMNHEHTIHKNRKSMKHCWSWTTYEHEHELNFDHDQKSHHETWCEYEDFEIFSVAEKYCNKIMLLITWRSQWNSQSVLDYSQE